MVGEQLVGLRPEHYAQVIGVVDEWWGGRPMAPMLPRLFFDHFGETSFAVEHDGRCVAFLTGFVSQSRPTQGYIHFVGVNPEHRKRNMGRRLYEHFIRAMVERGVSTVSAVTSPQNTGSLAFHLRMGFEVAPSECERGGMCVHPDYDGPGEDRVLLELHLPRAGR